MERGIRLFSSKSRAEPIRGLENIRLVRQESIAQRKRLIIFALSLFQKEGLPRWASGSFCLGDILAC
jgi:hypothetical protein